MNFSYLQPCISHSIHIFSIYLLFYIPIYKYIYLSIARPLVRGTDESVVPGGRGGPQEGGRGRRGWRAERAQKELHRGPGQAAHG